MFSYPTWPPLPQERQSQWPRHCPGWSRCTGTWRPRQQVLCEYCYCLFVCLFVCLYVRLCLSVCFTSKLFLPGKLSAKWTAVTPSPSTIWRAGGGGGAREGEAAEVGGRVGAVQHLIQRRHRGAPGLGETVSPARALALPTATAPLDQGFGGGGRLHLGDSRGAGGQAGPQGKLRYKKLVSWKGFSQVNMQCLPYTNGCLVFSLHHWNEESFPFSMGHFLGFGDNAIVCCIIECVQYYTNRVGGFQPDLWKSWGS